MLLPAWLYKGVFYGLLACAAISLLYYAYRPRRARPEADALPRATLRGSRWRPLLPWLPRVGLVGGLAGAWCLNHISVDVILVSEGPSAQRMIRLGEPSYPLAPGTKHDPWYSETWVLNESSQPVRIETVSYGSSLFGGGEPTVIPPGTAVSTTSIEYIGPGHGPPTSLEVEGVEAKMHMTSRSWLTWDRASSRDP